MAKARSFMLVIDASIAGAAGDSSMHPTSRNCRDFLQTVLKVCHRMVLTTSIRDEWNQHQSGFSRSWRKSMMARKKIEFVEVPKERSLEKRIARSIPDKSIAAIVEKDRRLIEAGLATDQRIASLDEQVRHHLRESLSALHDVASICWVNPTLQDESVISWLESGAPADGFRLLGHKPPNPRDVST